MKILLTTILISAITCLYATADVYKWEDEKGLHFVDDLSKVPVKYRGKYTGSAQPQPPKASTPNTAASPAKRTKLEPKVINNRLDLNDLQRQARELYQTDIESVCSNPSKYKKCVKDVETSVMIYYLRTLDIFAEQIEPSERNQALNWSL